VQPKEEKLAGEKPAISGGFLGEGVRTALVYPVSPTTGECVPGYTMEIRNDSALYLEVRNDALMICDPHRFTIVQVMQPNRVTRMARLIAPGVTGKYYFDTSQCTVPGAPCGNGPQYIEVDAYSVPISNGVGFMSNPSGRRYQTMDPMMLPGARSGPFRMAVNDGLLH
jgi:hypothetical protein